MALQTPIPRLPQVGSSLERIGQACEGKPAEALGCVTVMCQRYADEAELETQLRHSLIGFDAPQDFTPSKNFALQKAKQSNLRCADRLQHQYQAFQASVGQLQPPSPQFSGGARGKLWKAFVKTLHQQCCSKALHRRGIVSQILDDCRCLSHAKRRQESSSSADPGGKKT